MARQHSAARQGENMAGITLFKRTKELETQTDEFCDKVSEGALAFMLGINCYLDGEFALFDERREQVLALESRGDQLRREIQRRLYVETLLPESRGDVLQLLENTDGILNACESAMWQVAIEKPVIATEYVSDCKCLLEAVVKSVDALVTALRAFFNGSQTVSDQLHKVIFYESEADTVSRRLMTAMFASDMELAHKNQLRHFVLHIDRIADTAEDVADHLTIFVLKRAI